MNNDFGKYQELVNNWAKKNDVVFVLPEFLDLFKQIEKEGRVDFLNSVEFKNLIQSAESKGAINELKAILHLLDELEGMNFSANWYKRQIKLRVKELLGGKE